MLDAENANGLSHKLIYNAWKILFSGCMYIVFEMREEWLLNEFQTLVMIKS